jgi:hypothetical protein
VAVEGNDEREVIDIEFWRLLYVKEHDNEALLNEFRNSFFIRNP